MRLPRCPRRCATQATERVRRLQPAVPEAAGLRQHPAADPIETKHFMIALDPQNGRDLPPATAKRPGAIGPPRSQPLALFSYQTLSKSDYDRFFAAYLKSQADWAPKDFGKPNIERFGAESRTWLPTSDGMPAEQRWEGSQNSCPTSGERWRG